MSVAKIEAFLRKKRRCFYANRASFLKVTYTLDELVPRKSASSGKTVGEIFPKRPKVLAGFPISMKSTRQSNGRQVSTAC